MKTRKIVATLCLVLVLAVMCIALCACNSDDGVELVKDGEVTLAIVGDFKLNSAIVVVSAKQYKDGTIVLETLNYGTIRTSTKNAYLISGDLSGYGY